MCLQFVFLLVTRLAAWLWLCRQGILEERGDTT